MGRSEKIRAQLLTTRKKKQRLHKSLIKIFQPQIAVTQVKKRRKYESVIRRKETIGGFTCDI